MSVALEDDKFLFSFLPFLPFFLLPSFISLIIYLVSYLVGWLGDIIAYEMYNINGKKMVSPGFEPGTLTTSK